MHIYTVSPEQTSSSLLPSTVMNPKAGFLQYSMWLLLTLLQVWSPDNLFVERASFYGDAVKIMYSVIWLYMNKMNWIEVNWGTSSSVTTNQRKWKMAQHFFMLPPAVLSSLQSNLGVKKTSTAIADFTHRPPSSEFAFPTFILQGLPAVQAAFDNF